MGKRKREPRDTRERILQAAGEVFAAKGYAGARVAEICRKAGANGAAVNYHFGGKKNLYVESWRHEFHASLDAHPIDGGVPPAAPPEERLRGRIEAMLRRALDPESRDFDILHKEMASSTGFLAEVKRECIEPIRRGMTDLVREILGPGADEERVRLCQMSVISQCLGPMLRRRRRKGAPAFPPLDVDVETLADHIARFSLAGMRASGVRWKPGGGARRKRTGVARGALRSRRPS